jgi:hypothetical protein
MLEGKMLSAYSVTPAEPVSKPKGMLTGTEPTEVTITSYKGALLDDWLGYKFRTAGCSTMSFAGLPVGAEPDVPLQAAIHAVEKLANTVRVS